MNLKNGPGGAGFFFLFLTSSLDLLVVVLVGGGEPSLDVGGDDMFLAFLTK